MCVVCAHAGFPHVIEYQKKKAEAAKTRAAALALEVSAGINLPKAGATALVMEAWADNFRTKHMTGYPLNIRFPENITKEMAVAIQQRFHAWKVGHSNSKQFDPFMTDFFKAAQHTF